MRLIYYIGIMNLITFAVIFVILLLVALFYGANIPQLFGMLLIAVVTFFPLKYSPKQPGLLRRTGRGNDDSIELKINDEGYPDIIFRTTKESAGGVTVSNPEQHLYAAAIMKIHNDTDDTRNNRELKLLVGNAPATSTGSPGEYKLLIKDKNIFHGKELCEANNYYVRIYRQIKPIDFKSPKDPKNYDIEQIADAHNLQSIGELKL